MTNRKQNYRLDAIAVMPNGSYIIGGGGNEREHPGRIFIWDAQTGELVNCFPWDCYVLASLLITPDNRHLIAGGRHDGMLHDREKVIKSFEIETGHVRTLQHGTADSIGMHLSFTEGQNYIRFGDWIWDWRTGGQPIHSPAEGINQNAVSEIHLPLEVTSKLVYEIEGNYKLDALAITPDQRFIVAAGRHDVDRDHPGRILIWNFQRGKLVKAYPIEDDEIENLLVTPDNRLMVVSSRKGHFINRKGQHGQPVYDRIVAYDLETGTPRLIYQTKYLNHVRYLPLLHLCYTWDQRYIRFGEWVWDWQTGGDPSPSTKDVERFEKTTHKIELSENLFLSSAKGVFQVENIQTGNIILRFQPGPGSFTGFAAHVTTDKRYVLAPQRIDDPQTENYVYILCMWDMRTGKLLKFFESCRGRIMKIKTTANNQYAAVLMVDLKKPLDNFISVLNLQTGQVEREIDPGYIH